MFLVLHLASPDTHSPLPYPVDWGLPQLSVEVQPPFDDHRNWLLSVLCIHPEWGTVIQYEMTSQHLHFSMIISKQYCNNVTTPLQLE